MKHWTILLAALLLSACASQAPLAPPNENLFRDQLFGAAPAHVNADQIFALSAAMRQYAKDEIRAKVHGGNVQQTLFNALYRKSQLKLDYDSAMTRNASQTFEARAGNCLSLVIMTAALAREMDLTVQFQSVPIDENWSRSGNLYVSSGHVNLVLGKPRYDVNKSYDNQQYLTIDFLPPPDLGRQQATPLDERTVVAMYMNNRAAETLAENKIEEAYWWARKAVVQDPAFLNAYNTLGVIYQHHGNGAEAARVLRHAHQQAPDNTVFLFNLAQALRDLGQSAEAQLLTQRLAKLEPYPPFHFFNQGVQAMRDGDFAKARNLFNRELDRSPDYHEFHFWLAAASFRLGDLHTADKHMKLAMENSTNRSDHDLYTAKLDRIRAHEAQPQGTP
ncbi:tetratricopeptide repeat protein [Oxalobacteraceae bacterium]|nr:tetratricopeptide repeat protein [Oxalobacteraceae bacterium]